MDFTLNIYKKLLLNLKEKEYSFFTFEEFLSSHKGKTVCLRHDVDKLPENSLKFARIQNSLGIKGTYFFRIVPESFDPQIIKEIADLGHEIGYHYEDIDLAVKRNKSEILAIKDKKEQNRFIAEKALELFKEHLEKFKDFYPVKTICMHGSPLSKYDNKLVWEYYNYKDFKLIGEPYYDIDFNQTFYITDTGRRWDGNKVSVRDKVTQGKEKEFSFHCTQEIIKALQLKKFPERVMFTFHPQRWTDNKIAWTKELLLQNTKNIVKKALLKIRK